MENRSDKVPQLRQAVQRHWGSLVLAFLLLALLVGAGTIERGAWPTLVGDEATYFMQAESVGWDLDLRYERSDYDRFKTIHDQLPEGLILQRPADKNRPDPEMTYGKPFFYAVYLAPFVRLMPERGAFVANAVLLIFTAVLAAGVLRRRLAGLASLWVALLVFGSVTFVYTFWAHADLFMMCLGAIALALAADAMWAAEDGDEPRPRFQEAVRWALVGLLLAAMAFSRPMYGTLFLPAAVALFRARRESRAFALAAFLGGAAFVVLGAGAVHQQLTGSWTSYGAVRAGFYSYTGFPEVDGSWDESIRGNRAWLNLTEIGNKKVRASLWSWNLAYYFLGRHVGLLPYFVPVLLALIAAAVGLARGRPWRIAAWRENSGWLWNAALVIAVVLSVAAFLHLRPFNFWGGGGAVANRYFLPLYPAFWFLVSRRLQGPWLAVGTVVAALFLMPVWLAPRGFPLFADGAYRYVSPMAQCCLPYETTQSHLKPSGQEDVHHNGFWVKFLDDGIGPARDADRMRLRHGGGTILIGSNHPLQAINVELRAPDTATLRASPGTLERQGRRNNWQLHHLVLDGPRARHPMWWSWEPLYLYRLRLVVDGGGDRPLAFRLRPESLGPRPEA